MAKGSLRVSGVIIDESGDIQASTGDNVVIREDDGSAVITVNTDGSTDISGALDVVGVITGSTLNITGEISATEFTGSVDVSSGTLTLADDQISGDRIHSGTISDFSSTGIDDNATSTSITVDNGGDIQLTGSLTSGTIGTGVILPSFVGMIAPFAMSTAPLGWLPCDGGVYLITDYQNLYNALGTTWDTATDPTTGSAHTAPASGYFRVPDFRGSFLRGIGTASGKDATTLAGYQEEKTKLPTTDFTGSTNSAGAHSHSMTVNLNNTGTGANYLAYHANVLNEGSLSTLEAGAHSHTVTINGGGDTETRPLNFGVYYCIKF